MVLECNIYNLFPYGLIELNFIKYYNLICNLYICYYIPVISRSRKHI